MHGNNISAGGVQLMKAREEGSSEPPGGNAVKVDAGTYRNSGLLT